MIYTVSYTYGMTIYLKPLHDFFGGGSVWCKNLIPCPLAHDGVASRHIVKYNDKYMSVNGQGYERFT